MKIRQRQFLWLVHKDRIQDTWSWCVHKLSSNYLRSHDIDGHMHQIGNQVQIALGTSPSTLGTEGLLVRKPQQEEAEIVDQQVVGVVIQPRAFLDEVVVSG